MRFIWLIIAALLVASCAENNDFVTESGVEVSCVEKGDGPALTKDSIVIIYLKIVTGEDDKVLMQTEKERPLMMTYDPAMEAGHIQEVLNEMEVGDSVVFETTVQNLFQETYKTQVPPDMNAEDVVTVNMRLARQMSKAAHAVYSQKLRTEALAKETAKLEEKKETDAAEIDAYLDSLNVSAETTESGLRYVITEEGSGPTAEAGDQVTVHYDGRLLNGDAFDSSRERGEPFTFPIGQGRVIPGWDEGIPYIKEGGKATLYIPSPMAYGARSPSPKIPAYSILVFDVEVLNVEKK